ncbi:MAG TPA: type III glutamate--ammonia ligase, partial [Polyangiales bacterium]|nr:type III glutamate--ammonia ligase [Polyangiales bacterium]
MNSVSEFAQQRGVRYFLVSFTDLRGTQRAKLVPAAAIDKIAAEGAGFAGFATWLDMTPADPDMLAMALPETAIQLPWKPEVAWVVGELVMGGKPVEQAPRRVLTRQIQRAAERGYTLKCGVECEFFLLTPDGAALGDGADRQSKPCYDQQALMRRYDTIAAICDAMLKLGWEPYQNDHEDANGQFEMNWTYADALTTADRHAFFKYMVKTIAELHGLRATFMPKPFRELSGNGCHTHVSLWASEKNVFAERGGELGLSRTAYQFLGGLLANAPSLCAITNPTVNSYKRIHAPVTHSGATWSPNTISYTGNNRTHMIRIPDSDRFELRLADGATNPYLLQAAVLAAGLDGLAQQRDPGPRRDNNMYSEPLPAGEVGLLPSNLLDSIRALRSSETMRTSLGPAFVDAYCKLKEAEWNEHQSQLSAWEREVTLDC